MTRTDIINELIEKYSLQSYLEIGTRNKNDNYNLIKAPIKMCIDPDINAQADIILTSDEFFKINGRMFDIVFIDGMHEAHQVYRDILNSLKFLNNGGVIVLHDCKPETNERQKEFESYDGQEAWNGDVWKAYIKYRYLSDYYCYCITEDFGCGIIDTNKQSDIEEKLNFNINELCYNDYLQLQYNMNFKNNIEE